MPWSSGQSVTTGSIASNIDRLFVFGSVDAYKDLVSGTTYTGSLGGAAAFGSDLIGTYVESFASGDKLTTGSLAQTVSDTDYSLFITFSRSSSAPNFAGLFQQTETSGTRFHAIQLRSPTTTLSVLYNGIPVTVANNISAIALNTEFTIVITKSGTSGKYFYKGGAAPIAFTSSTFSGTKLLTNLVIGAWAGSEWYPGRFRAYGRWTRALSDAEAQSMADNPQQIITPPITPTTISANAGNAVANGGGQATVATSIMFGVGGAVAAGSTVSFGQSIGFGGGNAVAGGPAGATVSENITLVATTGNAAAAGAVAAVNASVTLPLQVGNAVATGLTASISVFNPNITIACFVGNADAAGQQCQVLPPLTTAPSATPGYAPKTRYRVRVGTRWMEVDPLDPMSVRRAYDAAQEDAQDAATQDVEAPAAVAAQAVVVQPIKGPDYAGLAKEARRISEDIRKVYADALQTALIARLMREQIERDDEDDIAVLLASI